MRLLYPGVGTIHSTGTEGGQTHFDNGRETSPLGVHRSGTGTGSGSAGALFFDEKACHPIVDRTVIKIDGLSYCYPHAADRKTPVLEELRFEIHAGERIALLGANGSGKSTLLNCLNGLLSPPPHTIFVYDDNGLALDPSNEDDLEKIRRCIATVLQNPDDQIISSIVEEDTAFGPENLGFDKAKIEERVSAVLKRTGLEKQKKQQVRFLSGGERQRLALAGVLALDTEIIVLDEAVSMLDPLGRDDFLVLLGELSKAGKTIIQVTHSLEEAYYCSRALVLYAGRLVFDDKPEVLLARPELEKWGFALPEQIKLFRILNAGFAPFYSFTMDAVKAAESIASALEAGVVIKTGANNSKENTAAADSAQSDAEHTNTAPAATVSFIDATHKYSRLFPGGMNKVNFEAAPGQVIALIGQSGSGKSTVLKHINALLLPAEGNVVVLGNDTLDTKTSLPTLRMKAALSIQNPESALFEAYVADDVSFGPRNSGIGGAELVRRVKTAMEKSGLPFDTFADREIRSLSGGEKRRAAIAGTAAMESEILLLDEAYTGLDGFNQKKITDLIDSFRRAGKTVIITTHSMEIAALADKVGVMAEEKLAAFDTPHKIFGSHWDPRWGLALPWTAVVSRFLAAMGLIPSPVIPLTVEELLQCLTETAVQNSGKTKVEQLEPEPPVDEGSLPGKNRVRAKRKKTGIEFFRVVSFEELPPGSSALQNMAGGLKLLLLLTFFAATLIAPPPFFTLGILAVILSGGWFAGRTEPVRLLRGFFRILPWLLIICAVQLVFNPEPMRPIALILRIASLSALLSLFCAVTPLRELVRVINRMFSFFARFGFPARSFSLAVGIAIRFIPVLSEEAEHIVSAQLSRGGKRGRFRMAFSLIVPLFLRALERADVLAKAMMLRCYRR